MKYTHVQIPDSKLSNDFGFTAREYSVETGSSPHSTYVVPKDKIFLKVESDTRYVYEIEGRDKVIILETSEVLDPCCINIIRSFIIDPLTCH